MKPELVLVFFDETFLRIDVIGMHGSHLQKNHDFLRPLGYYDLLNTFNQLLRF